MPQLITDVKLETFQPPADATIEVTTAFDDGQSGAWSLFLDGAFIGGGTNTAPVALGAGAALGGKTLEVSAVINDTQGNTNRLGLHVGLTGRADTIDIVHEGPAGGRAAYSVLVVFGA